MIQQCKIILTFLLNAFRETWKFLHEILCNSIYSFVKVPGIEEKYSVDALETVEEFEKYAPSLLDPRVRDYVVGGPGREITVRENQKAFETIRIRRRALVDISSHSLKTTVLGREIQFPIAIAPTSGQAFLYPDGEIAMTKGVASMGTIMILSNYSNLSLEVIAACVHSKTNLWMEMNFFPHRKDIVDLVRRAEKAGFKAIVVAVDVNIESIWHSKNYDRYDVELYQKKANPNMIKKGPDASRSVTFADITWLKSITHLPIVIKGILSGEDAIKAANAGASAVYVSSHGGRRLDGCQPAIDVLSEVVDAVHSVNPKVEVYMDSGIRNGFDVFKALARGARCVFIGRPSLWGLAIGGERGVKKVLSILRDEFEEAMLHAGFTKPSEITRDSIVPQTPNFSYPL